MKNILLVLFILIASVGYSQTKLYKDTSVVITSTEMRYPGGVIPFVTDTTGKPTYTDSTSIKNWSLYGGYTSLTVKQIKDEIDTLVVAKTFAACTDLEKDVASKWFVVDKSDRDTRHTAIQQEKNAERLVRALFPELSERDIIICRDAIKGADKTTIVNIINTYSSPSLRIKTGSYTGDGTTSQSITGIGFNPKFVQIFERITAPNSSVNFFITTPEIMDDNAEGGAVVSVSTDPEHKFRKNAIISLDADGFTVDDGGTDLDPNKLNQVYNYWIIGY